jgi:VHL beta domain
VIDMRLSRLLLLLPVSVVVIGPALADTRIFSVQTDRPGTTVTAIERNGQSLSQVGQSGVRTFFEINDGDATVPCSNQLAFTVSNGQRLEYIVDLCAHNWQVTLPLGAAEAPPASSTTPSAPSTPPTAPASLTVYTDDPTVGIDEINIDKQPVAVANRQGNAVSVNLSPAQRSKCEHDLGLALDDGRRIARMVDVCTPNGSIVVALNDDSAAPGPAPPPIASEPAVPPPPPVASTPPPPPSNGEIEVVEGLSWSSSGEGNRATLTYGLANSDQAEFFAGCNRGSRQVEVSLERSAPEVRPGASVSVTFTAGIYAHTFTATGSDINAVTGRSQPELTIATDDPFWTALIKEAFLVVQTGTATPYALSLKGSSAAGRPFIDACNSAAYAGLPGAPAVPGAGFPAPPGSAPTGATGGDYPCSGEATLRAQRTNIESKLIVRNQSGREIQLFWIDYDGNRRPFLSLGPGETGVQPTFFTHPWLVADSSGRCMAIYYARNTDRTIVVGP